MLRPVIRVSMAAAAVVGMRTQSGGHLKNKKKLFKKDSAPRSILLCFSFASFTIFTGRRNLNAGGQLATVNTIKTDGSLRVCVG